MKGDGVRSVVVDFDGTICPQDVSEALLDRFGDPSWWEIDLAFQRGEIGSRECLVRQGALLRADRDEMLAFALDGFAIRPSFPAFARWASASGVRVVVASDGFGFYVRPMLRVGGVEGVDVLVNESSVSAAEGASLSFPHAHPVCVGCGVCKMRAVLDCRRDGRVAFVGEGHSDRYGALYADVVFAQQHLVGICRQDGIPFVPWDDFDDVRSALEQGANATPVGPEVCPGWTG
jgi:2,3-diketo-5-methylthio-1-phosphopentane phosphatase